MTLLTYRGLAFSCVNPVPRSDPWDRTGKGSLPCNIFNLCSSQVLIKYTFLYSLFILISSIQIYLYTPKCDSQVQIYDRYCTLEYSDLKKSVFIMLIPVGRPVAQPWKEQNSSPSYQKSAYNRKNNARLTTCSNWNDEIYSSYLPKVSLLTYKYM